jgi:mRNA-degrading endonuclease RelE of RelBE toxin-antitoxin system
MMTTIKVDFSPLFLKELTQLKKKYPRVVREVNTLVQQLETGAQPGDKIPHIGYDVYKVRLKNPSSGKGKRSGFRAVYYVQTASAIFLLTLYSKNQQEDIAAAIIRRIIEELTPPDDEDTSE